MKYICNQLHEKVLYIKCITNNYVLVIFLFLFQIMLLSTSFKKNGISDSHLVDSSTQTCHFNYSVIEPSKYNEAENLNEEVTLFFTK